MLYFAQWKVLLICAVCALGVLLSLPNLFTPAQLASLPHWLPHKQVALGLDLRGGSYLLLEVNVAAAEHERLNSIVETVRNALRNAKIGYTGLNVEGDAIVFTIRASSGSVIWTASTKRSTASTASSSPTSSVRRV